jgi:hypothetical protein
MRMPRRAVIAALLVLCWGTLARAAGEYPMKVALNAQLKAGATTVTSVVTIAVERLMEESRRTRVTDGLKFNGYAGALKVLRSIPAVGTIEVSGRPVEIKFAHEQPNKDGYRLVLVADQPLFFLSGDAEKKKAGYELTIVDLQVDAKGGITGTMAGAARAKPGPDGLPILDDFAAAPVKLEGNLKRK